MEDINAQMSANWSRVALPQSSQEAGRITDFWVWYPHIHIQEMDQKQVRHLRFDGWRVLPSPHSRHLFCLMGQLFSISLIREKFGEIKVWARNLDLSHVKAIPLALAFALSADVQVDETTMSIAVEQPLPPPQFGEVGIILKGSSIDAYPIDLLGEEGIACQKHLGVIVSQLTSTHMLFEHNTPLTQEVHEYIQRLVSLYWQAYQKQHSTSRSLSKSENIFRTQSHVPIPATSPVQAVLAAYSNAASGAKNWKQAEPYGFPQYRFDQPEVSTCVEVRPSSQARVVDDTTIRSLWRKVRQLSDLDSDVFLTAIAQVLSLPADEGEHVWLTSSQILDYRGIKPVMNQEKGGSIRRRAGHRQEDTVDIAACFERLNDTWVTMRQSIDRQTKRGGKGKVFTLECRLLIVNEVIHQHEIRGKSSTDLSATSPPIAWHYSLGTWFDHMLSEPTKQIAWLCQEVLHYNPCNQIWEKRLARYFLFHLRLYASGGGTITRTLGTLINELSLSVNQRDPEKTRKRFEQAMQRLEEDRQIEYWIYAHDNEHLPRLHWLEIWLSWKVQITVAPLNPFQRDLEEAMFERVAPQGMELKFSEEVPP